ncbi:MAG TPA: FHA domain-containing protein [Ktedonobacterales bacterium]
MVLAFGGLGPLVVAAAALSRGVLVAAAGVVVVLAILLVFVMVLRGGGSSRQKASGLDYDAQQGPMGQPHAPSGAAPWSGDSMGQMGGPMGQMDGMGQMGGQMGRMGQMDDRFDSMGQGRSGAPQQAPGWGANFGEPAQAANNWGADANAPAAGQWNDQMAPAGGQMGQMGGLNDWPPAPSQGRPAANAWDMPSGAGAPAWNGANGGPAQASPATRPGAGAAPWDAPAQPSPWDAAPAAPSQPQWAPPQPAAPSQPQWSGQSAGQPQWAPPAAPSQPQWAPPQPDAGMGYPPAQRGGYGPRLTERKPDGREFDLNKDRLTIGRHRESDVFLEDLAVSRLHTTINRDPSGRYILRDENSANGTYVNGQRVSEYALNDGDEVQVGQTVLVFHQR